MKSDKPHNVKHLNIDNKERPSRAEPSTNVSEQAQISYVNFCRAMGLVVKRILDKPRGYKGALNV